MTESQNHRRPLAPGEIRTHTVGDKTFKIMHTGNGAYTQATVRTAGVLTTEVLATLPFEPAALKIYATAIEHAEHAAAPSLPTVPQDRSADGVPEVEQAGTPAPTLADDEPENATHLLTIIRDNLRRYVPGGGEQYLDRYLAAVEGAVPQRATDADGWGIWQHECGAAQSAKRGDGICDACGTKSPGPNWRALYTLGGE